MSLPRESESPAPRPPIRWWPAMVFLGLAIGAGIWVKAGPARQHQDQNIAIALIAIVTVLLLLLWCLTLSRMRWQVRLLLSGATLALIALAPIFFRIRGVTGDLIPIPEWRWKHAAAGLPGAEASPRSTPPVVEPATSANDYPQFLGPNRNATLDRPRLLRDWRKHPPQQLWRHPVGAGWSGFAVVGNRAVTQEQRGDEETVSCYHLRSGALLWRHAYPAHFMSDLAGEGPRATPTISGGRVFTMGSTGILTCLGLEDGRLIWSKDAVRDNQSKVNEWGMSCSPLVVGDWVVVSVGGSQERSLVACQSATGAFAWGAGGAGAGYSSPAEVTLAGVPQILIFNSRGVFAHETADGKILWNYPWPGGHPHVAMPVVLPGDRVLVSSGYGFGSEVFQLTRDAAGQFAAKRVWKSTRLKAKFTNVVHRDGFIYGLDDGVMVCLDAATGELKWRDGRYGHGQEILVGDLLLVTAESGEIILLEPSPEAPRELARFRAFRHKLWNPPALAGECLLLRTDREAACYRLPIVR